MDKASKKRPLDADSNGLPDPSEIKPTLKQTKLNVQPVNKPTKPTPWHANQQLLTKFIPIKRQVNLGNGHIPDDSILISCWNVDGLKRIMPKGEVQGYFRNRKPDILCFNETKIDENEVSSLFGWLPSEYTPYFNSSRIRKGYSGVAIITKYKPISVQNGIGIEEHDKEGRVLTLEFETFYLVCCYVPNSGKGFKRISYRVEEWDPALRAYLVKLKEKKTVIVCGDFNVTHQPIDTYREGDISKFVGSSPIERSNFGKLLEEGFIDTFRYKYPDVRKYSWWLIAIGDKEKNIGGRYDYVIMSKDAIGGLKDAYISCETNGSDHCPVEILFNPNFALKKEAEQKQQNEPETQKQKQEDKESKQLK